MENGRGYNNKKTNKYSSKYSLQKSLKNEPETNNDNNIYLSQYLDYSLQAMFPNSILIDNLSLFKEQNNSACKI